MAVGSKTGCETATAGKLVVCGDAAQVARGRDSDRKASALTGLLSYL